LGVREPMGAKTCPKVFPSRFWPTLGAPPAEDVAVPEIVTRFVFEGRYLYPNGAAKWKVFEPSRLDNSTSVFIIDELSEEDIWLLAPTRRDLSAVAHAALTPADIRSTSLELEVDNDPPRHAAITGWPDDWTEDKSKTMILAKELAARAIVTRRN